MEYIADVDFKSKEEWAQEVQEAFALVQAANANRLGPGGTVQAPEENTPAHEAWCKLRAAYGTAINWTCAQTLLGAPPEGGDSSGAWYRIQASLSTTYTVTASNGSSLCSLYSKCVDSVNDASLGSLWPIVKRVLLRGPWPVLSSGVCVCVCGCVGVCVCVCVCVGVHVYIVLYIYTYIHTHVLYIYRGSFDRCAWARRR